MESFVLCRWFCVLEMFRLDVCGVYFVCLFELLIGSLLVMFGFPGRFTYGFIVKLLVGLVVCSFLYYWIWSCMLRSRDF